MEIQDNLCFSKKRVRQNEEETNPNNDFLQKLNECPEFIKRPIGNTFIKLKLPMHPAIEEAKILLEGSSSPLRREQYIQVAMCFIKNPIKNNEGHYPLYLTFKEEAFNRFGLFSQNELKKAFTLMDKIKILRPQIEDSLLSHPTPIELANAYLSINRDRLLTIDNIYILAKHPNPLEFSQTIFKSRHDRYSYNYLKKWNIYNNENVELIYNHPQRDILLRSLGILVKGNIYNQQNRQLVIENPSVEFANGLRRLNDHGIFTAENLQLIINNPKLGFDKAFAKLVKYNAYTNENRILVINARKPHLAAKRLVELQPYIVILERISPLTQESKQSITSYIYNEENVSIAEQLKLLNRGGLLNEISLNQLLHNENSILISAQATSLFWNRLPPHLMTIELWNNVLAIARSPEPLNRLQEYLQFLYNEEERIQRVRRNQIQIRQQALPLPEIRDQINDSQSVHLRSVHDSASKTAKNFYKLYGEKIKELGVKEIILTIQNWMDQNLTNSLEHSAAKRCIRRIGDPSNKFIDKNSGISTRELLALFWIGIQDDSNRISTLEEAINQLMIGLYEIQRGYNIDAQGIDNLENKDKEICTGGTFNKIIEKLVGIHSQAVMLFITKSGATMKLPPTVKEIAMLYLNEHKELIKSVKENGIEVIWNDIKERIAQSLFNEYKLAFNNNINNSEFQALIDAGQYVDLNDIPLLKD